jgi:excisionase family DNA binding protein
MAGLYRRRGQPSGSKPMTERLVLTRAEVAKTLGVSLSLVDELIRTHRLACIDVGRRRLIPAAALTAFIQEPNRRAQPHDAQPVVNCTCRRSSGTRTA